jgi:hypothetical protein
LPQSECTFCLNLSKPSACVQGDHSCVRGDHTFERDRKSVCGQLLIRSILVLLFSFEVPLTKKLSKKSCSKKKQKDTKKATTKKVRAATSEFSDFASVWWEEYGKKHPNDIPQTWIALKRVMRARFFPHTMHVI